MDNFVFQNHTRIYFGKGVVEEYLAKLLQPYGKNVLLAYGGGSIKPSMSGASRHRATTRRWPPPGWRPWPISSARWACRRPCSNWA